MSVEVEAQRIPRVADVVRYTVPEWLAAAVVRLRTESKESGTLHAKGGNAVTAGDVLPLVITKLWGSSPEAAFNGTLLLDGNHTMWVTSTSIGTGEGKCAW